MGRNGTSPWYRLRVARQETFPPTPRPFHTITSPLIPGNTPPPTDCGEKLLPALLDEVAVSVEIPKLTSPPCACAISLIRITENRAQTIAYFFTNTPPPDCNRCNAGIKPGVARKVVPIRVALRPMRKCFVKLFGRGGYFAVVTS